MCLPVLRVAVQPDSRCGEATEEPAFSGLLHSERIPDQPAEPAAEAGHQQGGVQTLHRLRQGTVGHAAPSCRLFFLSFSVHPSRDLGRSVAVMLTFAHMLFFLLIYVCSFQLEQQRLSPLRQMFRQVSRKNDENVIASFSARVSSHATLQWGFRVHPTSPLAELVQSCANRALRSPCCSSVCLQKLRKNRKPSLLCHRNGPAAIIPHCSSQSPALVPRIRALVSGPPALVLRAPALIPRELALV